MVRRGRGGPHGYGRGEQVTRLECRCPSVVCMADANACQCYQPLAGCCGTVAVRLFLMHKGGRVHAAAPHKLAHESSRTCTRPSAASSVALRTCAFRFVQAGKGQVRRLREPR